GTGVITHHNSEDKPETVDPRSMRDLVTMVATYLYYTAQAGERELPWLTDITLDRALTEMQSAASAAMDSLLAGDTTAGSFGLERVAYPSDPRSAACGLERIAYLCDSGLDAILSLLRLLPENKRVEMRGSLDTAVAQVHA